MRYTYDIQNIDIAIKATEGMIAYASFSIKETPGSSPKDGVMKVSAFHRNDGSGYLTFSFFIDNLGDQKVIKDLDNLFNNITENAVKKHLGQDFQTVITNPLTSNMSRESLLHMSEINLYFHSLQGREKYLLEEKIIPLFSKMLGCHFKSIEWWIQDDVTTSNDIAVNKEIKGLKSFFTRFFG